MEPFENLNRIILPTIGVLITLYFYYEKNENLILLLSPVSFVIWKHDITEIGEPK